ncbi:hypothetical protein LTR56_020717 [Elasticomyces elasticus]|nr:hypothetical protein LTR56_020717 [Elasticomyces elasticus]KAK3632600.1 hypothetical protein LTR22_020536 [Elasticomyces elasticus]KAK4914955.1 hypothetical protein LTR49_016820 [Elasticomyces elasticus]KAK5748644.1 hypothetical protein LTS12_021277 [Elasticomyces elasticus]
MSSSFFNVTEHVVPCSHIREYPRATASGHDDPLELCVKQYSPVNNPNPQPGDVTIIATHGSGLPKELYEPLFEDIVERSQQTNVRIRSVWIADCAHQGASGIRNERKLGNDPSWFDHCRDLLAMVQHFREDMPRPLIGIGHSMGATQLTLLSLMHPRLFTSLILCEPVMDKCTESCQGPTLTKLSTFRRDVWPSREDAVQAATKSYRKWDSRVLQWWNQHAFRELPTIVFPESKVALASAPPEEDMSVETDTSSALSWNDMDMYRWFRDPERELPEINSSKMPVTLATTKHQEVFSYLRPNFSGLPSQHIRGPPSPDASPNVVEVDRLFHPDIVGPTVTPFYRAEPVITHMALPHVRPSVLYVFGERSPVSSPQQREDKLSRTGTSVGGSGGAEAGRVKSVLIGKAAHLAPMEATAACAEAIVPWLVEQSNGWKSDEVKISRGWAERSLKDKATVSEEWTGRVRSLL